MIYFDNAATSRPKPEAVYNGYDYFMRQIGASPGRGSYGLAVQASRMLYQSRKTIANYFGSTSPENVIFTKNSTEAINLFFYGYLKKGDHVLISPFEHNAVLRPLHNLKINGVVDYSVLPEKVLYSHKKELVHYVTPKTKMIVLTLASNLTGQIVFSKELAEEARKQGILVFVDASQGGGKGIVTMEQDGIDVLAFTGHKDLYGIPGVGGIISSKAINISPLIQGGTGIHGESYINPDIYPDSYEAGTLNMPAIWALKCAIEYIQDNAESIRKKELMLTNRLIEGLKQNKKVELYRETLPRVSTLCFNIKGMSSSDVVRHLDLNNVCVRGGIHCAILAHETLNTVKTGAVRISMNSFNTIEEVDEVVRIIGEL